MIKPIATLTALNKMKRGKPQPTSTLIQVIIEVITCMSSIFMTCIQVTIKNIMAERIPVTVAIIKIQAAIAPRMVTVESKVWNADYCR